MKVKAWRAFMIASVLSPRAIADGPLGPNGAAIQTSSYSVDMSQGVVLAGTRVLGMAGAYVAIGEGVDGLPANPAAAAVRLPWSRSHWDYDLGFGLSFPGAIANTDFFNTGEETRLRGEGFLFLNLAGLLQIGHWGVGGSIDFQQYRLFQNPIPGADADRLAARFFSGRIHLARAFADHQLVIGAGVRGIGLALTKVTDESNQSEDVFSMTGGALEVGILWKPNNHRFRLGAALRSEVLTNEPTTDVEPLPNGDRVLGDPATPNALWLPDTVTRPGDLSIGAAVALGPKPLNPRFVKPRTALRAERNAFDQRQAKRNRARAKLAKLPDDEERKSANEQLDREQKEDEQAMELLEDEFLANLRREHRSRSRKGLLISAQLVVKGPTEDAVGVESFVERRVNRSGENTTLSPHLGFESEVLPLWTKLRVGGYLEPSRFASGKARPHGTFGFDQKLVDWTVFGLFEEDTAWRVSGAIDYAPRYLNWSVSLGVWH